MKLPFLVFAAVLVACSAASQTANAPGGAHGCRNNEDTCVDGNLKPTGYCCPEMYACGGPFPNVGCAPGECCPTQSGGPMDERRTVRQRRAE